MKLTVSPLEKGIKLVEFLKKYLLNISSRKLKRFIDSNQCTVNGRIERFASTLLNEGDHIQIDIKEGDQYEGIEVLYEDDSLIAINKKAGQVSDEHLLPAYYLLHRLDKGTTGVLLFAKDLLMKEKMELLFRKREIEKVYHAIVDGHPKNDYGVIKSNISKIRENRWAITKKGKYAETDWFCEKRGKESSLIRCLPKTGRTHQIRLHLKELGHPILGDYHYCSQFISSLKPKRYLLHASSVMFIHPINSIKIVINSHFDIDFINYLPIL